MSSVFYPPRSLEEAVVSNNCLCQYFNATSRLKVVRIADIANWYFERVVFPGQRLMFEAPVEAHLEIYTSEIASAILEDRIPCQQLLVIASA
jgi:Domain of unknown function (DUF1830)